MKLLKGKQTFGTDSWDSGGSYELLLEMVTLNHLEANPPTPYLAACPLAQY